MKNAGHIVTAKAPLLRPGLEIRMGPVSEKYLVEETKKLLDLIRQINEPQRPDIARSYADPVAALSIGKTKL